MAENNLDHYTIARVARCGSNKVPASPQSLRNMVGWLKARQQGVEQGRTSFCLSHLDAAFDCLDQVQSFHVHVTICCKLCWRSHS